MANNFDLSDVSATPQSTGNASHQRCPEPHLNLLLRFDQSKWLHQIVETETLRFTPIENWRKIELDDARSDPWEGATSVHQKDKVRSLKIKGTDEPDSKYIKLDLAGPVVITDNSRSDYPATHAFCFSMIHCGMLEPNIDIDLTCFKNTFGPSILAVMYPKKLLEIVRKAAFKVAPNCDHFNHGAVEYVSRNYSGKYSIFKKQEQHTWQREFRVAVHCPDAQGEFVHIPVPGLAKMCQIIDAPEMRMTVSISDGTTTLSLT